MITLTTPPQINSVLGGNAPVGYNKLVLTPFTMDPFNRRIIGNLRMTSTTNPEMPEIIGSMSIDLTSALLIVSIQQLDFYQRKTLSGAQMSTVQGWINSAQNSIENGLIAINVIAGTQTTGA